MEVNPHYKQTEVGIIPEDWKVQPANQIGTPVRGGSPRPAGDSRFFNGSYVPWLTVAALTTIPASQLVVSETGTCLTEEGALHSRTLSVGTLIIANSGATLGVAKILGIKCCANDGIAALLNLHRSVSPHYLAHFINTKTHYLRDIVATGNGQPNLNTTLIGNFKIPLPPTKAEQEAIAAALSDADALIESLERLLTKKRQLKQGAMQELLTGKKRLPGFTVDWQTKRLAQLADIRSGGTPSTTQSRFWDGEIPWCTPTDITALNGFKYLSDTSRKITHEGLKSSSAEIIPADSVVMTSRATIGQCAINQVPVSTNQGFKNFTPFANVEVEFLYYLLTTQTQGFIGLCGGSTFLEIGKAQLRGFEVYVPTTKAEQTAVAAILHDIDAEITVLEAELAKAGQVKQGMMQELLTGRIRLV
jgi:type I restriction enzyme S subunit